MELLDVVDADDRVIGQASRDEAHAKGLLHRLAFVIARDREGVVYLNRRLHGVYRNCLDVLAEHVRSGERYDTAAWRGLREYGVRSGVLEPLFQVFHESCSQERGFGRMFEYAGKPVTTGPGVGQIVAVPDGRLEHRLRHERFTPWGSSVLSLWLGLPAKGMERR